MEYLSSLLRQAEQPIVPPHNFVDKVMLRITSHAAAVQRWQMCKSAALLCIGFLLLIYSLSEMVFDLMMGEGFDFLRITAEEPATLLQPETHFALWEVLPFQSIVLSAVAALIVILLARNFVRTISSALLTHAL